MTIIYEPLYEVGQQLSEAAFQPLPLPDNSHAAWREFRILIDFWRRGEHRRAGKTGIFSPKFGLKTKVSATDFLTFVDENPKADVCFINPFPQIAYYSYNVWMQGEANHPGLLERSQALLDAAGIRWSLAETPRNDSRTLCYSNFWAGTELFWDVYVGGVLDPIARFLEGNPDHEVTRSVMDPTWHSDPAPFLPFITERLFSAFLALRTDMSAAPYPIADMEPYFSSAFERESVALLKPMVDAADIADKYPDSVKRAQQLYCEFLIICTKAYYETHAHPHTGRTIKPS